MLHEDRLHRRRPGRALFRDLDEAARPVARDRWCSSATAPATRSAGASSSPTRRSTTSGQRSGQRRGDRRRDSRIGTTSTSTSRGTSSARPATASSASAASACSTSSRSARASSASQLQFEQRGRGSSPRIATTTWSSPPTASTAAIRDRYAAAFGSSIEVRSNKFVWLGTRKAFDAFTFAFEETEHGWIWAHAYRFAPTARPSSSNAREATWRGARLRPDGPGRRHRRVREAVRQISRRPAPDDQRRAPARLGAGSISAASTASAGTTATSSCWATPRTPPISRSARAPSSRSRMRSSWPRC